MGQLLFVAAVFAVLGLVSLASRTTPGPGAWAVAAQVARPGAYAIGVLGAFWLIERTLSFWQA